MRLFKVKNIVRTLFVMIFTVIVSTACATSPRLVYHSFSFDARWDSPDAEILNYRYGDSKHPGARPRAYSLEKNNIPQQAGITGKMLRGDRLFVKWRIKSTGEIYEDTVDLRSRLPADISRHRITFIVNSSQLYVYLISPKKKVPNPCPSREQSRRLGESSVPDDKIFSTYCHMQFTRVYPN